jgi:tRNA-Thr(GGU) m(6)t(6)A37 methyltransferase TsaA
MQEKIKNKTSVYQIYPVGIVRRDKKDIQLEIIKKFRPAIQQLDKFSHLIVLWWADKYDDDEYRSIMEINPPYAQDKTTGIFATRAEYRPNPIGITTCEILDVDVDKGIIKVKNIDAFDGTKIIDIKAYFPVLDKAKDTHIPEWLSFFDLEFIPDEGVGLYEELENES